MATTKKEVLVTGASGVIGEAIARALGASGWRLHLTARDTSKLAALEKDLRAQDSLAASYAMDLRDTAGCADLVRRIVAESPEPFGLVCNAGNPGNVGPFLDVDFGDWQRSLTENFLSNAAMIRAFSLGLRERKL